jgi:hypothetical protein
VSYGVRSALAEPEGWWRGCGRSLFTVFKTGIPKALNVAAAKPSPKEDPKAA